MAKHLVRSERSDGRPIRCAIYTRKSTEEGLEKEFNSLDAQREACAAYIVSQRHEGWTLLPDQYDDGGYSGGSMERPGLKQLMADVAVGKVDVIVVYKVDRLTRALSDFAKIVDVLDAARASFVSITQSFNTTTSMGRLTLNVLLSFAQFEREVISERVRDKIAASKKKGMWMGGPVPLGYDVVERKLIVNAAEAETVRHIMHRYLELGTVPALVQALATEGIVSKRQFWSNGRQRGGTAYGRGALYNLLGNQLYRGKIVHKGAVYEGAHEAVIDDDLGNAVQARLSSNGVDRTSGVNAKEPSPLAGMITDDIGRRMKPSHASKGSLRYRYYVSVEDAMAAPQHRGQPARRIAAGDLERLIIEKLHHRLNDPATLMGNLVSADDGHSASRVVASTEALSIELNLMAFATIGKLARAIGLGVIVGKETVDASCSAAQLAARLGLPNTIEPGRDDRIELFTAAVIDRRSHRMRLVIENGAGQPVIKRDGRLMALLVKAHGARRQLLYEGAPSESAYSDRHLARMARLAFLAPDITASILNGTQPPRLTARQLLRAAEVPLAWSDQRRMLGYS